MPFYMTIGRRTLLCRRRFPSLRPPLLSRRLLRRGIRCRRIWTRTETVREEREILPAAPSAPAEEPVLPETPETLSVDSFTPEKEEDAQAEQPVLYNSTSVYTDSTIIGQVFDTYILLQYGDEMVMIDQHAAHERIKYEEIKEVLKTPGSAVSPMLVPLTLQLTPAEHMALKTNLGFFEAMGFELEDFGGNTVLIRAVPSILDDSNIEDVILAGLQNKKTEGYTDEEIYTMACKAAVKANKKLSYFEIEELLKRLGAGLKISGTWPARAGRYGQHHKARAGKKVQTMPVKALVITGPTASGKTSVSIELAHRFGAEVISADSMQIYKYMDIGTAKPTTEEMEGIPHHMLDVVFPWEEYSVAQYAEDARRCHPGNGAPRQTADYYRRNGPLYQCAGRKYPV